ncbi:hypothetical protein HYALB_00010392 [Hymenoscyphus albidus]|uniref:Uncharacterized protein n=1 Tax=Hymenoscyphus albidus TaxID=595503 RepID=A0A9N9Q7V1_9HELO|nr:hypothetical protein HYALB_00010392 [Hymenoscyphus albidus]
MTQSEAHWQASAPGECQQQLEAFMRDLIRDVFPSALRPTPSQPQLASTMAVERTIARLESLERGEGSNKSRLASAEFRGSSAVRRRGGRTRIVARPCYGPGRCENALCGHSHIVPDLRKLWGLEGDDHLGDSPRVGSKMRSTQTTMSGDSRSEQDRGWSKASEIQSCLSTLVATMRCQIEAKVALAPPETAEIKMEGKVVAVVRDRCLKEGYNVSETFARQWCLANDLKILGAVAGIQENIDSRERRYQACGRTNWVHVNVLADNRPQNMFGEDEYRDERIRYLEDDDIGLQGILKGNWNSAYGREIKERFAGDKVAQKKQYKLYRAEAKYRKDRGEYHQDLHSKAYAAEEIQRLLEDFDTEHEPKYDLDKFPEEEDDMRTSYLPSEAPAAVAEPAVVAAPNPEPPRKMGHWTKLYLEAKADFEAFQARKAEEDAKDLESSDEDEEFDGSEHSEDDGSLEAQASDEERQPPSNLPEDDPVGEDVCDEEEELPTNEPVPDSPTNNMAAFPPAPELTMEALEAMTNEEQVLQFLLRPNGRGIIYQKIDNLKCTLVDRINALDYYLKKYADDLDEESKRALELQMLHYRSQQERIERKDYRVVEERILTGQKIVRFDNHGDEEAKGRLARKKEAAAAYRVTPDKPTNASSAKPSDATSAKPSGESSGNSSGNSSNQPGGFMNLGFEKRELTEAMEKVVLTKDLTPEERTRRLAGVTDELTTEGPIMKNHDRSEEEKAHYLARFQEFDANRQKYKGFSKSMKPKAEKAEKADQTDKQDDDNKQDDTNKQDDAAEVEEQDEKPVMSEKARGKQPIRPWEQNTTKTPPVTKKPVKSKKHSESLFKKLSKNTIESKLESMKLDNNDPIANLAKLRRASAALISDIATPETPSHDEGDTTFDATHDPDAEEANVDAFFADDTTDMDELQTTPGGTTNTERAATTNTTQFSGATIPESEPARQPPTAQELAFHEIEVEVNLITNRIPVQEREFFRRVMRFHQLTGYRLYRGKFFEHDVAMVIHHLERSLGYTPPEGIDIGVICKLLGLCNNDPIRAYSFLKILYEDITVYFEEIGVRNATWSMYEATILRWELYYWHCLLTIEAIMTRHNIVIAQD